MSFFAANLTAASILRSSQFHRHICATTRLFTSKKRPLGVEKVVKVSRAQTDVTKSVGFRTHLRHFLGPKPMPERYTFAWYREVALICTVFAITGSSTMVLVRWWTLYRCLFLFRSVSNIFQVRPAVKDILGLQGTFVDGPWSYRIASIFVMSPIYASLLVAVGTVFGRHFYFRHFAVKIFSRFGIPPELMDKNFHHTKHTFKKW